MKKGTIDFEGETIEYVYPEGLEEDLDIQIPEIFKGQYYKEGRRKKDAVYIDMGANIGMASIYFAPYAKKIYAIEPSKQIFEALKENTKNYPFIECFNVGIAHRKGRDWFYSSQSGNIPQTFFGNTTSRNAEIVELTDLNSFMEENRIEHVDVLKIDVEESEYLILPSLSFIEAAKKIDFIIGESHFQVNGGFPDLIPLILKESGFKTRFLKCGKGNYIRRGHFVDEANNISKDYVVRYNTMFVAEK